MDIVDARHLIDVAAYLCGAGSLYACDITELLDRQAQQRFDRAEGENHSESDRLRSVSWQPAPSAAEEAIRKAVEPLTAEDGSIAFDANVFVYVVGQA